MKRFSRLEFGDRNGAGKKKADGQEIRDEEYFRQQAVRFWLAAEFELALRNYSRALERNSMLFEAWLGQVLMLIELREYPEAMVWADKALELFPEHPDLLAAKAVACSRDGRREKALAYSDNSISKENAGSRVWLARSEVLLRRNSRVAETCLSKAVGMASQDSAQVRLEAGRLLNRTGSHGSALEYLRAAVEALPKSALAWYELGCCQAKLGRAEAEAAFEHTLKLRPDWEQARTALRRFKKRGILRKIFRI
ncbi:MAG: tetratricopeptide repeat protein [Phycisphaerales bacterium]|nr:MAG: tetratricopeptide repeat protein [Phycisphaerales bacterium]